jgi:DNA-binding MarR family transcriptional regulator
MSNRANKHLSQFLAEVVLTSHYLAEPVSKREIEISDAEMKCLKIIAAFEPSGPLGMHEIADKLHASKPRATQLVALLEAHDMVTRTVASDRRRIQVRTSAKGKRAIAKLEVRYAKLAEAIESKLGPDDTAELVRLLAQITPLTRLN